MIITLSLLRVRIPVGHLQKQLYCYTFLFVRVLKKSRTGDRIFIKFQIEKLKEPLLNQLHQFNSRLYRKISRNVLQTFVSGRAPVYRSAHA
jgi:hypothetical protein